MDLILSTSFLIAIIGLYFIKLPRWARIFHVIVGFFALVFGMLFIGTRIFKEYHLRGRLRLSTLEKSQKKFDFGEKFWVKKCTEKENLFDHTYSPTDRSSFIQTEVHFRNEGITIVHAGQSNINVFERINYNEIINSQVIENVIIITYIPMGIPKSLSIFQKIFISHEKIIFLHDLNNLLLYMSNHFINNHHRKNHGIPIVDIVRSKKHNNFRTKYERNVTMIINPFSGMQKGVKLYNEIISPILLHTHIYIVDVIITKNAEHLMNICKKFDFSKSNEIIIVGGDGTLKLIIDGFFEHESGMNYEKIFGKLMKFSVLPSGSANGINVETADYPTNLMKSLLVTIRGRFISMDVATIIHQSKDVNNVKKETCMMFANLASTSDVNCEFESWRWMGSVKFILAGLYVLLRKRIYKTEVKFVGTSFDLNNSNYFERNNKLTFQNLFTYNQKELDEEEEEEKVIKKEINKWKGNRPRTPLIDTFMRKEYSEIIGDDLYYNNNDSNIVSYITQKEEEEMKEKFHVRSFIFDAFHFVCSNFKKLTPDLWATPYSSITDGTFDIQYIKDTSRLKGTYLFFHLMIASATRLVNKVKEYPESFCGNFRANVFYYKALERDMNLSIDGEIRLIKKGEAVIGEVHEKIVRVSCWEEKKM